MAMAPRPTKKRGARKDMTSGFGPQVPRLGRPTLVGLLPIRMKRIRLNKIRLKPDPTYPSSKDERLRTPLSDPHELFTTGQVTEQRAVERFRGVQERVVDSLLGKLRLERRDVFLDQRAILRAERLRHDRDLLAALQILERRRIVVVEVDLLRIEHVKHDQVVAKKFQRFDPVEDCFGRVVEVRDEQQDTAAFEMLRHLMERRAQM